MGNCSSFCYWSVLKWSVEPRKIRKAPISLLTNFHPALVMNSESDCRFYPEGGIGWHVIFFKRWCTFREIINTVFRGTSPEFSSETELEWWLFNQIRCLPAMSALKDITDCLVKRATENNQISCWEVKHWRSNNHEKVTKKLKTTTNILERPAGSVWDPFQIRFLGSVSDPDPDPGPDPFGIRIRIRFRVWPHAAPDPFRIRFWGGQKWTRDPLRIRFFLQRLCKSETPIQP